MRLHRLFFALCLAMLCGCDRGTRLHGAVTDVQGNRLPGVAVTLRGAEAQAMTDGLGEYTLRCAPGQGVLDFIKTDYTPGWLEVAIPAEGAAEAPAMQLFRLPATQGVYLFDNFQYHEMTRTELQAFNAPGRGPVWASKVGPDLRTPKKQPLILYFKLPSYDTVLHRLEQIQAAPPRADAASKFTEGVWTPQRQVTALVIPVDEPDHLLYELRPAEVLEPGVYAVSWGAFDGHMSTAAYVYLFEVFDPEKPSVEAQIEPPDAQKTPAKSPQKTKPKTEAETPAESEPAEDGKIEG